MENKSLVHIFLTLILVLTLCSFISAEINVKNISIDKNYFGGENLRGWINMSLENEPYDTLISAFDANTFLLNFLNNNKLSDKVGLSCSIINCTVGYETSEKLSDTINLAEGTSKTVGFVLSSQDKITDISKFLLNISTNAGTSCSENMQIPLKIDILDDNSFEWSAKGSSLGDSSPPLICGEKNYGCFDPSEDSDQSPILINPYYCERINIGPGAGIYAGVDLTGSGEANFTITLALPGVVKPLSGQLPTVTSAGSYGASFNSSSESARNITVCIQAKNSASEYKYSLGVQTKSDSCGYSGTNPHDFSIYAQPIAYSVPETLALDFSTSSSNKQKALTYLASRYGSNCSDGCVIPVKIIANQKQELTINDKKLTYLSGGLPTTSLDLYELVKKSPLISMNSTKLDISKTGLSVPSSNGNYTLNFKLGNKSIVQQSVVISNIPSVDFVFPYEVIVSETMQFSAYSNFSEEITSYKWDFGDGSPEQTTTVNSAIHKYGSEGEYNLKITAISSHGQTSSTFQIDVLALSKENILKILNKDSANLEKIESELNKLPTWLKDPLNAQMEINNTQEKIQQFISSLNSTDNLTEVISYLSSLKIASSFGISESSSGVLIIGKEKINPDFLKSIGAGTINSGVGEDFYKDAIYDWLVNNIEINVKEDVYSLFYNDKTEPVASYFKITIIPKEPYTGKLFVAINKNLEDLTFKNTQTIKNKSQITAVILDSSSSSQEIEFFATGDTDVINPPLFLSPEFSKLDLFTNPKCFIDGKCDPSIGEDAETCPADCKSNFWKIFISLLILLIIAFIVYIILQEWYKKRYEDYLFKSKDDLYNVINFISNAEKQSISKSDIFRKLLEMKWSNEQITFAYKKFHGQRTGMYEIPIFKIFEKRKVQLELGKRQAAGVTGNNAPKPMIIPPQTRFTGGQKIDTRQNINQKK